MRLITFCPNTSTLIDSDSGGTGAFANEPSSSTVLTWTGSNIVTVNVADCALLTGFVIRESR